MLTRKIHLIGGSALALLGMGIGANAQVLQFTPPRASDNTNHLITFSLTVDRGAAPAVAWGTDLTLADPSTLQFVSDFGGAGKPFLSTQPFFDLDLSSAFTPGSATLNLNFLNSVSGLTLGGTGSVVLGQFQVRVLKDPGLSGSVISIADLATPPLGSALEDADGNNLLVGVSSGLVTQKFPSPEPEGWLAMASGSAMSLYLLRRKRSRA